MKILNIQDISKRNYQISSQLFMINHLNIYLGVIFNQTIVITQKNPRFSTLLAAADKIDNSLYGEEDNVSLSHESNSSADNSADTAKPTMIKTK